MWSNEHAIYKNVICQMSDIRSFVFFIHTAMLHERLLSTCGSGKESPAGRSGLLPGRAIGRGTLKRSAQHVVEPIRLLYEAQHTGTLHFKFEIRVDV